MYDHDKVIWVPLSTLKKLKNEDKKSFNVKYLESNEYPAYVLSGELTNKYINTKSGKHHFLHIDYSSFLDYLR